jgi:hypothetical protein
MFVGRVAELRRLESALAQTKAGSPLNIMITGERGIGKSSLLNYFKDVACGRREGLDESTYSFLVIDTDIDENTTQIGLIKKIQLGLSQALGKTETARSFLTSCWEFLQRVEAGPVKLRPATPEDNDELLLEQFAYSLADLTDRLCADGESGIFGARSDGILILLDEADNAATHVSLGSFFKLLTERLQRRGCSRVAFGIAGLPELRNVLSLSHKSSLRLFEELPLERLSAEEVNIVIELGLKRANRANVSATDITPEAAASLVYYSEGYPHFIQQFAYSAFASDTDGTIDEEDVNAGAFARRGALELIADRYYRDDFYNRVQQEGYRDVLRIMAGRLDDWVTKREIREAFDGSDSTLDNALSALRERRIILAKEGERGVYRLQHKGFAWWIKLYATKQSSEFLD